MSDPRRELRRIVTSVRRDVDRLRREGRPAIVDESLADWLRKGAAAPAGAPGPAAKSPPASGFISATFTPPGLAPGSTAPRPAAGAAPRAGLPKMSPPKSAPGDAASAARAAAASASASAAADRAAEEAKSARTGLDPVAPPADEARPYAELTARLAERRTEALACTKCGLCETRTQVVYSAGTARYPLMFVGEAPGFHEDQQGVPFVGRAGQLLTDIITAMGVRREDIYIANVLKCRPPENRDPLPHEIEACWPWLEEQIELVRPRVLCTVGKYSAQLLTGAGPRATIGSMRGKVYRYKGLPVVPTYHPAFLLRSPSFKRATWEDVQIVRDLYLAAEGGPA
jgi:uracil-DNA glycosylase family 4